MRRISKTFILWTSVRRGILSSPGSLGLIQLGAAKGSNNHLDLGLLHLRLKIRHRLRRGRPGRARPVGQRYRPRSRGPWGEDRVEP